MVRTTKRSVQHTSRIELSQSALRKNINFLRKKVGKHPRISSVIKANAYGHGIAEMVAMLEACGIDHFSVASAFEAEEVLEVASPESTIMIMGILYDRDIDWAIRHDIEFYVFTFDRLKFVAERARAMQKQALVHIEVETGTNRTGMTEPYFEQALEFLKENREWILFQGICTHLGGAEDLSNKFKIDKQIDRYRIYLHHARMAGISPQYRHAACSAAALAWPETIYDMVRIGVATYGFWPSPDIYHCHLRDTGKTRDAPLSRIISWKTDIMDIKEVPEGEYIGYGTAYQATRNMFIGVVPVGYCNGYPRGQSNRGYVLVHGRKAPIVGLVNMNLFMIDISHIPEVVPGDEVVLIGKQKHNTINVSSFTNAADLLNNEMLSRLPTAIPRHRVR